MVNTASRAQSVAEADQILVTKAVFHRAQPDLKDSQSKAFQLKGYDAPIELYRLEPRSDGIGTGL